MTGANIIDKKENYKNIIYRGYYMSAHVLLNLLNELGKRDILTHLAYRANGNKL